MGYAKNWLTKEEWKKLIQQDMKWRDELLQKTTYRGALRIHETLSLKYPFNYEIEENNGYVILTTQKTDEEKPEKVPIGSDLVKETKRYMKAMDKETTYVFSSRQGNQMTRQRAYQIINERAKDVGIDKKLGTHTLRRSRAKHLLDEEVDLSQVSALLRHENLKDTMEYLKIAKKELAELTKQIDKKYGL
ncbi:MAG: XerD/XerC family integrase [Candidatus Methanohalarchaeum thermophilum]|uniref:XerD/XerC family integrase n=1 Tax=Methanohalarchaeum thermophilum TaxID=1903181 RepID=A0A1Q6DRX2_METT1|nr:MAG: XerD/XerC family integrase [Candidatus Methanohalarchaeum thermophilum]